MIFGKTSGKTSGKTRGAPAARLFLALCLLFALPALSACAAQQAAPQNEPAVSAAPHNGSAAEASAQRPKLAAPEAGQVIRFAAMGDIMMGNQGSLPSDGGSGLFRDVRPHLADRDVVLGNLEGPLTDRGRPSKTVVKGRSYVFRTPPGYGKHLRDAGLTVLSLANNHANDYGPEGRAQTREVLDSLGIKHTGAPGQIAWQDVKGRRVAFIGLAPNSGCQNLNDIPGAVALVKKAAREPDSLVVVTFHGGAEGTAHMKLPSGPETYLGENRGDLRKLSRAVIDAGADLVVGHGPHVPRGFEVYKNRLIAYSLGNFATAAGINIKGATGLAPLLLADLAPSGELLRFEVVSFRQQYNQGPKKDPSAEAKRVMRSLSQDMLAPEWLRMLN